jgi:hypothetical protein
MELRRRAVSEERAIKGEKIYECDLDLMGVTDFGVRVDDILSGKAAIPLQGARFDLAVEGQFSGRLAGRARGTDFLRVRADGRMELDLRLVVETDDGQRIALSGGGQAAPRNGEPVLDIFGNICLSTASSDYAWVNERQIWSVGSGDLATGKIRVSAYMQ